MGFPSEKKGKRWNKLIFDSLIIAWVILCYFRWQEMEIGTRNREKTNVRMRTWNFG